MPLFLTLLAACTGAPVGETGEPADTDTDTDADTDTDTDTDPGTACISGSVVAYDGTEPADLEVQVCDRYCVRIYTDSSGAFSTCNLDAGSYKVDAVGELIDGGTYGRVRAHVDLGAGETVAISDQLYLPRVYGPETVTSGTYTFGDVSWTVDVENLDVIVGYEADQFWAGTALGEDIPTFFGLSAEVGVAFLPFDTAVSGAFDVSVRGTWTAAEYDVYSFGSHGETEGPIGTATAVDGTLTATGIQPELLSWLLFVPK